MFFGQNSDLYPKNTAFVFLGPKNQKFILKIFEQFVFYKNSKMAQTLSEGLVRPLLQFEEKNQGSGKIVNSLSYLLLTLTLIRHPVIA